MTNKASLLMPEIAIMREIMKEQVGQPVTDKPLTDEQLAAVERALVFRFGRTWPHWQAEAQVIWVALSAAHAKLEAKLESAAEKQVVMLAERDALRAEVERLNEGLAEGLLANVTLRAEVDRDNAEIAALRAENEKLREALESLVKAAGPQDLKRPPFPLIDALNVARAALQSKGD